MVHLENTRHALIVEDEPLLLESLGASLRRVAWLRISMARSAEEALEIVGHDRPDIVITDVRMPGMGGLELLDHVRKILPDVPIVVMTAYGVHLQRQALRRGATFFLEKPFRMSELRTMLQTLFAGQGSISPGTAPAFEGRLEALSLSDVVQVSCLARQHARIEVNSGASERGIVWVRDGDVVDAFFQGERGIPAFSAMASFAEGSFRVIPEVHDVPRHINVSWQELLLDCAREFDEKQAGRPGARMTSLPLPRSSSPSALSPDRGVRASGSLTAESAGAGAPTRRESVRRTDEIAHAQAIDGLNIPTAPAMPQPVEKGESTISLRPSSTPPYRTAPTLPSITPSSEVFAADANTSPALGTNVDVPTAKTRAKTIEPRPGTGTSGALLTLFDDLPLASVNVDTPAGPLLGGDTEIRAVSRSTPIQSSSFATSLDEPAPGSVDDAVRRAADAIGQGRVDRAQRILSMALERWPEDRRVRANLQRLGRISRP